MFVLALAESFETRVQGFPTIAGISVSFQLSEYLRSNVVI